MPLPGPQGLAPPQPPAAPPAAGEQVPWEQLPEAASPRILAPSAPGSEAIELGSPEGEDGPPLQLTELQSVVFVNDLPRVQAALREGPGRVHDQVGDGMRVGRRGALLAALLALRAA